MKLFKQDYISFDGSGSFVTVSGDAREKRRATMPMWRIASRESRKRSASA